MGMSIRRKAGEFGSSRIRRRPRTHTDSPFPQLEHYTLPAEASIDRDPERLGRRVYQRLVHRMLENGTTSASVFGTISVEAK